jgi:predicted transposase YbfD/YdcC
MSIGEQADHKIETSRKRCLLSRKVIAPQALAAIRAHWTIENQPPWVLDVAFEDDRTLARCDNAPLNLDVLRRIVRNLIRANSEKGSIRGKIKCAGWDNRFLATPSQM